MKNVPENSGRKPRVKSGNAHLVRRKWLPNEFSGTVSGLADMLVEFVFPSESGVTYLSDPRLMTTQETEFPVFKELILVSIQYLPYCGVTCQSSARPMSVLSKIIAISWHHVASLVVYSLQIVVIPKFPNNMDCFVTDVCPTEAVQENPASLETSPNDGGSHHARALLWPRQKQRAVRVS